MTQLTVRYSSSKLTLLLAHPGQSQSLAKLKNNFLKDRFWLVTGRSRCQFDRTSLAVTMLINMDIAAEVSSHIPAQTRLGRKGMGILFKTFVLYPHLFHFAEH